MESQLHHSHSSCQISASEYQTTTATVTRITERWLPQSSRESPLLVAQDLSLSPILAWACTQGYKKAPLQDVHLKRSLKRSSNRSPISFRLLIKESLVETESQLAETLCNPGLLALSPIAQIQIWKITSDRMVRIIGMSDGLISTLNTKKTIQASKSRSISPQLRRRTRLIRVWMSLKFTRDLQAAK